MIEITAYRSVNKGSFLGSANVMIKTTEWGMIVLNKISVFIKDGQKWVNLPQEMFEKDGKKNFFPLVKFEDTSALKKFEKEFFMALEQFTKKQSTPFVEQAKQKNTTVSEEESYDTELPF
jgi:hypothetical protein